MLLPGSDGLYSAWYDPDCVNSQGVRFCDGTGNPDHHDFALTQHAVDIGAGQCDTSCPDVFYYDLSNSVTTALTWFSTSCSGQRGGGERVEVTLTSSNPLGVYQGTVAYLHLTNAIQSGSPSNGTRLGTVHGISPPADPTYTCWTGPHLHQGIDPGGSAGSV